MKSDIFQIDAFSTSVFSGNPAAVCPLQQWLSNEQLQSIAGENNLSETAFFAPEGKGYRLRWFTPTCEVDLCGHATLASAYVLFELLDYDAESVEFYTRSGTLIVSRDENGLSMDFPAQMPEKCEPTPNALITGLGVEPIECLAGMDYLAVLNHEAEVIALKPDFLSLKQLDKRGVIVTAPSSAPSSNYDFVSRFFAPNYGIDEDPVTGSAHTQLTPYWAKRLSKQQLSAKQISPRGGKLCCRLSGDRVILSGHCAHYMSGTINVC